MQKGHSQKDRKLVFETSYRLMQVKHIAAILLTFIKLPFVIKIFVLSIFGWPFNAGFTVINSFKSVDKLDGITDDQLGQSPRYT